MDGPRYTEVPVVNDFGHKITATVFEDGQIMFNHEGGAESITLSMFALSSLISAATEMYEEPSVNA